MTAYQSTVSISWQLCLKSLPAAELRDSHQIPPGRRLDDENHALPRSHGEGELQNSPFSTTGTCIHSRLRPSCGTATDCHQPELVLLGSIKIRLCLGPKEEDKSRSLAGGNVVRLKKFWIGWSVLLRSN